MSASLVGSEMCIRDRAKHREHVAVKEPRTAFAAEPWLGCCSVPGPGAEAGPEGGAGAGAAAR
eukprot:1400838-Alexandrium_andersonii.AAC.1